MGLLRLLLALVVLFSHNGVSIAWLSPINPGVAVYCFFILSGFYISMGLNERYVGPNSNRAFYVGRFWRLWPTYLLSLALLIPTGTIASVFARAYELPGLAFVGIVFSNIFIVGQDLLAHLSFDGGHVRFSEVGVDPAQNGVSYMLNMPAWSLAIECLFYAVAPFIVRSLARTIAFLCVGLVYTTVWVHGYPELGGLYRMDLYYPFPILFFGLGSLGYWMHHHANFNKPMHYLGFAVLACALLQTGINAAAPVYLLLTCSAGYLFHKTKNSAIDRFLGDLSYPVYILQIPVASFAHWCGAGASAPRIVIPAVLVLSSLAVYLIERPVDKVRRAYTARAMAKRASLLPKAA